MSATTQSPEAATATRPQSILARYKIVWPEEAKTEKTYIIFLVCPPASILATDPQARPIERMYIGEMERRYMHAAGLRVETEERRARDTDLGSPVAKAIAAVVRDVKDRIVTETGSELGSVDSRLWESVVEIRTPTALGAGEHMARRKILEHALRANGCAFILECMTIHSDGACRPIAVDDSPASEPEAINQEQE